jgi:hypothetical protein
MGTRGRLQRARHELKNGYDLTWRHVFNRDALTEHRTSPPVLGAAAAQALADLDRDGVAITSLEALTGDPTLLGRLQREAARLEEVAFGGSGALATHVGPKQFVVHLLGKRPMVEPAGVLAQTALQEQLKGVVDGYYGLRTRLADLNVWRTPVQTETATASQLWHRDIRDDHYVVKVFVYLEAVTEGSGPFCYVRGSHTKGPLRRLEVRTHRDRWSWRASDEDMAQAVPPTQWATCTGPPGTLVIADTNGYHKGGLARTAPRLLLHALYASSSARHRVPLRLAEDADREHWGRAIAFST